MLHSLGIDRGSTDDREVSVNYFSGAPTLGMSTPVIGQYVALPSSGLTFRRMFLPKAAKTVRQQVITEELSYSLPFPLTEAHYGAVEMGEEAWVTVAADSVVQPVRDLFPKAHLEAEPLCYVRAAKAEGIQNALVVDLGASKTVFCGVENGQVGTVRVMLRGGDALTQLMSEKLEMSREDAEILKREEGTERPLVRNFFSELVEEALLPSPLPYRRVLLCGGGSATPGLLRLLSRIWGEDVDIEPFPLPGSLMPTDHVVAYGAALAGRPNAQRLQMEHSFRHAAGGAGGPLSVLPLACTVLLMGLMIGGLETRIAGANTKAVELRTTLDEAVRPVLPQAGELNEDQIVEALRVQLQEQRDSSKSSPARIMNALGQSSNAVTTKKDARISSVLFEEQKMRLEGVATSLQQSEEIRASLEKVLENVVQVKSRPQSGGNFFYQIEAELPNL